MDFGLKGPALFWPGYDRGKVDPETEWGIRELLDADFHPEWKILRRMMRRWK